TPKWPRSPSRGASKPCGRTRLCAAPRRDLQRQKPSNCCGNGNSVVAPELSQAPMTAEKSWRRALLPVTATLREAIRNLDDSALQIVLIVSDEDVLLGTLTDGDIRRGLLRGLDLGCPIDSLMMREPLVVPEGMPPRAVARLMQMNRIHQLPV